MKKLRVVFCGTPDFSVPTLNSLYQNSSIEIVYVLSMPSRPKGRGMDLQDPDVIQYAKTNRIPYFQCENINKEEDFLLELESLKVDLIIVLAFAQFLGSRVLRLPQVGCFNIHTSILPRFRGAAPIQHAILEGDTETGVSIQKMVKKMDAGDLVHFKTVQISPKETGGTLYNKLKDQSAIEVNHFIAKVLNESLDFKPQDEKNITFAPTLKRTDGFLSFSKKSTTEIDRQIRALFPWPGTYTFLNGKRLKVFKAETYPKKLQPGEISTDENMLLIGCLDGTLRLKEVQMEGKKASDDQTLLNGLKNKYQNFYIEEKI